MVEGGDLLGRATGFSSVVSITVKSSSAAINSLSPVALLALLPLPPLIDEPRLLRRGGTKLSSASF